MPAPAFIDFSFNTYYVIKLLPSPFEIHLLGHRVPIPCSSDFDWYDNHWATSERLYQSFSNSTVRRPWASPFGQSTFHNELCWASFITEHWQLALLAPPFLVIL